MSDDTRRHRRIAIVGSRDYPKPHQVTSLVALLPDDVVVVSGGARGVDRWAAGAARARGLDVREHIADWTQGRDAGIQRSHTIVDDSDVVYAFWDGVSTGTRHTIAFAREAGKLRRVFTPDDTDL